MKPQWYIPEPSSHHDSENAHRLVFILQEMGCEVFCNKYRPFGKMTYEFLDPTRPVMLYGTLAVIKHVQRTNIYLSPFAWCDFYNLKCSCYYAWWGKYLVQRQYAMYPLAGINRHRDFLFDTFGASDCLFMRPDDNMKTFTGEVVERERFPYWWRSCVEYDAGPDCPCVVSRPEPITAEWRFVMRDNKVVTGSQYKSGKHLDVQAGFPDAAAAKAEEIAESSPLWQPHPMYVMDIALTDGEYRLMEVGSVNAAGLYASDLRAFAQAANELVMEEFVPPTLQPADSPV